MLAGYGLLAPGALRSSLLWLALAALSGWRALEDWPLADNHAYLLAYWCLALSIAFFASDPAKVLSHQGRWLIGLVFLLAVVQKGSTPNFVDGTFFATLYLLDPRFEDLTVLLTSLGYADLDAARRMMESGFATAEDIDNGMVEGCNHPMGPLELADFIGLDTCLAIMNVLHDGLADTKYRPCPLLTKYVEAGWLGRKTKRGFYDYRGEVPVPTR